MLLRNQNELDLEGFKAQQATKSTFTRNILNIVTTKEVTSMVGGGAC